MKEGTIPTRNEATSAPAIRCSRRPVCAGIELSRAVGRESAGVANRFPVPIFVAVPGHFSPLASRAAFAFGLEANNGLVPEETTLCRCSLEELI